MSILRYRSRAIYKRSVSLRSTISDLIELSKGDTVNLGALQDDSASESYQTGSANTYLSIYKIG